MSRNNYMDELEFIVEQRTNELKKESKRLAVTLASIGDGVVTIDRKGAILYMNPAAESLTDLSNKNISGKPVDQILRSVDPNTGEQCPLLEFKAGSCINTINQNAKLILKNDAGLLDVNKTVADIADGDGNVHGTD